MQTCSLLLHTALSASSKHCLESSGTTCGWLLRRKVAQKVQSCGSAIGPWQWAAVLMTKEELNIGPKLIPLQMTHSVWRCFTQNQGMIKAMITSALCLALTLTRAPIKALPLFVVYFYFCRFKNFSIGNRMQIFLHLFQSPRHVNWTVHCIVKIVLDFIF